MKYSAINYFIGLVAVTVVVCLVLLIVNSTYKEMVPKTHVEVSHDNCVSKKQYVVTLGNLALATIQKTDYLKETLALQKRIGELEKDCLNKGGSK